MSSSEPARPAVHVPVLLERVTELLGPALAADGAVLVDATLGLAGHSLALLEAHPGLRLIGLDRDPDARAEAARRIEAAGHTDRVILVAAVFDELPDVLDRLGIPEVQGVLFDLGVSSLQLDRPERGFSYSVDAPLDMRMDPDAGRTAAEIVNTYSPKDLARVLRVPVRGVPGRGVPVRGVTRAGTRAVARLVMRPSGCALRHGPARTRPAGSLRSRPRSPPRRRG